MSEFKPTYSRWRHGGWYVDNVRYPSGAVGCVSRNYPDGKWRIVCDKRPDPPTYRSRDQAAQAEWELAQAEFRALTAQDIYARIAEEQSKFPDGRADSWCNWLRETHAAALAA
jgi:hypothetical protein